MKGHPYPLPPSQSPSLSEALSFRRTLVIGMVLDIGRYRLADIGWHPSMRTITRTPKPVCRYWLTLNIRATSLVGEGRRSG